MKKETFLQKTLHVAMIGSLFLLGTAYEAYSVEYCGGYYSAGNLFPCSNGGNCTWWAARQAMDSWKISWSQLPSSRHAMYWDDDARSKSSFSVVSTPQVNSMNLSH